MKLGQVAENFMRRLVILVHFPKRELWGYGSSHIQVTDSSARLRVDGTHGWQNRSYQCDRWWWKFLLTSVDLAPLG